VKSLLDLPVPSWVTRRVIVIPAGESSDYVADEWTDALVIVERGCIDLVTHAGERYRFESGAILSLAGLYLRTLHNVGSDDAVIVALHRR
jgi:hypothetical protein